MLQNDLDELFEKKARAGDAAYAIAYALLQLAGAQDRAAVALNALGNANAATPMGAIEALSLQVANVASAIQAVAEAKSN